MRRLKITRGRADPAERLLDEVRKSRRFEDLYDRTLKALIAAQSDVSILQKELKELREAYSDLNTSYREARVHINGLRAENRVLSLRIETVDCLLEMVQEGNGGEENKT